MFVIVSVVILFGLLIYEPIWGLGYMGTFTLFLTVAQLMKDKNVGIGIIGLFMTVLLTVVCFFINRDVGIGAMIGVVVCLLLSLVTIKCPKILVMKGERECGK